MMVYSESEIIWKRRNIHFIALSCLFSVFGQVKVEYHTEIIFYLCIVMETFNIGTASLLSQQVGSCIG